LWVFSFFQAETQGKIMEDLSEEEKLPSAFPTTDSVYKLSLRMETKI